jgi:alkylresorcinol/alkylpyrone synthase
VPVFGLGCAGGVSGLALAGRLAVARPGAVVLMVAAELCSLAFRPDLPTKANVVATALFGDGAAACVVRAGGPGIAEFEAEGQYLWSDTLDTMGWSVDPVGFGVILDREIPPFVRAHLAPAISGILARAGLSLGDVEGFALHPGGRKVIDALEGAFALEQGTLAHERAVLADFGNMSAPTVLFVLERALAAGPARRTLLAALGPGFTASCLTLRAVA